MKQDFINNELPSRSLIIIGAAYMAFFALFVLLSFPVNAEVYEIYTKQAEQKVAGLLSDAENGAKFRVKFFGMNQDKLFLSGEPLNFDVNNFAYDKKRGTFKAELKYKNGEKEAGSRSVAGRFDEIAMIPVVKTVMPRGTKISDDDLDLIEVPVSNLSGDVLKDPDEIIGKSAARTITQMRPIRKVDVKDPAAVKKGELVTMIYRKGYVEIKTQGMVMEDAPAGHYTQVKNPKSGVVLQAMVEENGIVLIEGLKDDDDNSHQEKISSNAGGENAEAH